MPSTCGSYAFKQGKAKADSNVIRVLNDAGLIIIAKANLSVRHKLSYLLTNFSPSIVG